jgi:transcriptional regulator
MRSTPREREHSSAQHEDSSVSLYVPRHFASTDPAAALRLVHEHPFATLITPALPEPLLTHLPLLHVADREPHGTLLGHFARANPHAAAAVHAPGTRSIAVFHGPHAYVSPSWYADPAGSVPTWNYAVVHVHGIVETTDDPEATRAILTAMTQRFESTRAAPWSLQLEPGRLDAMVAAIVGFRLRIERIDVKLKLSQNRSRDDRERVAAALAVEGYADAAATAAWMRECTGPADDGES